MHRVLLALATSPTLMAPHVDDHLQGVYESSDIKSSAPPTKTIDNQTGDH